MYFDRSIMGENTMERNGVKGSCSFATVRTAEEIQKEIDCKGTGAALNDRRAAIKIIDDSGGFEK